MDAIEGVITRVLFNKPSKYDPSGMPFVIAKLHNGITVKGKMRNPKQGAPYRFWGQLRPQKGMYPEAFEFDQHEPTCDKSCAGVEAFLWQHIDGVGPAKAKAMVAHFGDETLTVLRSNPERALEVAGINEDIVTNLKIFWAASRRLDPVAYGKLVDLFCDFHISKKIIEKLLDAFGSDAPDVIRENPYILADMPRCGWKTCDAFATQKVDYPLDGMARHKAAILEAMARISNDGSSAATEAEILTISDELLGIQTNEDALQELIDNSDIVVSNDGHGMVYQLADLADAEETIARKFRVLMETAKPLPQHLCTDEWVAKSGIQSEQIDAARLMEENGVIILCGPPGCGKTFLLTRFLGGITQLGVHGIRVMAPTGKAAKRAAELLAQVPGCENIPSTTVHRALGPRPSDEKEGIPSKDSRFGRGREEFGFAKGEDDPLIEQVIVVDETSMLDVKICASLLRAIKPGTRLIFVGDHNQLPSVGPGSVLRDLMLAGIPCATLSEIRRSDGGGTVVRACHAIKDGIVPESADRIDLPSKNWIHIEVEKPIDILDTIIDLYRNIKTFDTKWAVQTISPQKERLPIGCSAINARLARLLNPENYVDNDETEQYNGDQENGVPFRRGDKIICKKNKLVDELVEFRSEKDPRNRSVPDLIWKNTKYVCIDVPVVNGDLGEILDVVLNDSPYAIVEFRDPTRVCRISLSDHNLILAYAITVHSSQGSGWPCIIIPTSNAFYFDKRKNVGLWQKSLIYTAISRAEQLLITVGSKAAIATAIERSTINNRRTTLVQRLRLTDHSENPPHDADHDEWATYTVPQLQENVL